MKPYRFWMVMALIALISTSLMPRPARADGLMILGGVYRQPSVSHITVTIESRVSTTVLEQTFKNPNDEQVTALYVAPVPSTATITAFAQLIDGVWIEAEVKDSEEAKKDFEKAAEEGKDAALASGAFVSIDAGMTFRTQVVLPANAERTVRLTFSEVLIGTAGMTRYTYPLSHSHLSSEPVGDLIVQVTIHEKDAIRAVYSPSHTNGVEIARPSETEAVALYRAQNIVPAQDFEIVYTQSADTFGLNVATHRKTGEDDGYFILIAAPQLNADHAEIIEKDFVFVLDRSGSMQGAKFEQARAALKRILDALNEGDRFTVIVFDNDVTTYRYDLVGIDQRDTARAWVDLFQVGGGTNINDSLQTALKTVDKTSERPHIVVFLTDGQASTGVVDTAQILKNVQTEIHNRSRIYTIGIGDVNKPLLESLARENRGQALFVDAFQPLEKPLAEFYAAIDNPVLVDLALDFGGIEVTDFYPNPLPDMFLGGQVVIAGRYKGGGTTTVTLRGAINGKPYETQYKDITFLDSKAVAVNDSEAAKANAVNSYVPRLWAQEKADSLVRHMAIHGPDAKLVDEVKALGKTYKIITPYTSFVVVNPNPSEPVAGQPVAGLPGVGLPRLALLYRDDFRALNTALMIIGGLVTGLGLVGIFRRRLVKR
ncbi:MAG TPA: VWA domain-containing protein [Aggregatilineales bacterium]|nr:VWA domain-containing protein [Anaerolineales bacterium]HRE46267.1 VWA domain-containing protein [Aggregatilineales bacterium]